MLYRLTSILILALSSMILFCGSAATAKPALGLYTQTTHPQLLNSGLIEITGLEEDTNYGFTTEYRLVDIIVSEGLSTTISKSAIGASLVKRKDPYIAFGLSVLVPGLGQFYNGQPVKGGLQLGLVVGGYTMFFLALEDDLVYSDGTVLDVDDDDAAGGLGILVAVGATIWSLIDAPISANNINKRNQMQAHLLRNNGYSVSPLVKRDKLGATFTLQF